MRQEVVARAFRMVTGPTRAFVREMSDSRRGSRGDADDKPWSRFADSITDSDLEALYALGRPMVFRAGEHLMRAGERGNHIAVLRSGHVKVVTGDGSGHERLIGVRGRGDLLGEMACLQNRPRSAGVVAHNRVDGMWISGDRFLAFLDRRPRVALEVARQVMVRLREAERRQTELVSHDVGVRLVRAMQEMIAVFAERRCPAVAEVPLLQEELAQLATASEVAVQRALRGLRDAGLVVTHYRRIEIPCMRCFDRWAERVANGARKQAKAVPGCGGSGTCTSG